MTPPAQKTKAILSGLAAFAVLLLGPTMLWAQQEKAGQTSTAELQLLQCALKVTGMNCNGCVTTVQQGLLKVDGVKKVSVDLKTGKVDVKYDSKRVSPEKIVAAFNRDNPGYRAALAKSEDSGSGK